MATQNLFSARTSKHYPVLTNSRSSRLTVDVSDSVPKLPSPLHRSPTHTSLSPSLGSQRSLFKREFDSHQSKSHESLHSEASRTPRVSLKKSDPVTPSIGGSPRPQLFPLKPHASQKSIKTPRELPHVRPITATKPTPLGTPKTGKPLLTIGLKTTQGLSALVTQVKPTANLQGDAKGRNERIYREHIAMTYQALKFVRTLPPVDPDQILQKRFYLPKRVGMSSKKTMIFDLDETLVHCCEEPGSSDVSLPVVFPTGEIVRVIVIQAGINVRPYARECLQAANQDFEVMVFTASHRCYADVVLDHLDPGRKLIHHRLYRDNCVQVCGLYIKDLRIFANRALEEIVIVDNAAYSFAYQLDNGVPIVSWKEDKSDRELFNLMDYMKRLAAVQDVRELNSQTFHLQTFVEEYGEPEMMGSPKVNLRR